MKNLVTITAIALLSGCAYSTFKPYEGNSANMPTAPGAFVDRSYGMPIYSGPPPRPYIVLGAIETSERTMSFEGCDHAAVRTAKAQGADAVIKTGKSSQYAGSVGGFNAWGNGYGNGIWGSSWTQAQWLGSADYWAIKFR